jgi:dihydrofolate reductase
MFPGCLKVGNSGRSVRLFRQTSLIHFVRLLPSASGRLKNVFAGQSSPQYSRLEQQRRNHLARILGYVATSLDGFIATTDESLEWLFTRGDMELGEYDYNLFIKRIRTVVMGRTTYDWIASDPGPWAYGEQRVIVVTSSPISDPKGPLETRSDVDALIAELRALDDGDVWMLGGGKLQMAFMERGALDEIEIYIISSTIGGGYPLFPPTGFKASPTLLSARSLGGGGARLHYKFD